VDAGTHAKISTGKGENKFGIPRARARAAYARARELAGIEVVGIDMHIGSQITALEPFERAFRALRELVEELRTDGHTIARADLGGGLGIPYQRDKEAPPLPADYARMIERIVDRLDLRLIFEPGRMIVGNAGILVSRVLYVKEGQSRPFIVLDAAMNDLLRPALYDAWHEIVPVRPSNETPVVADIVGPVCETGDTFATARPIPPVRAGDLVAILSAGAYGAAQASSYNSRLLVPEVLVKGADHALVRPRPSYEDLLAQERIAAWLV
jgi:diaminopimelate decarboxylase